MRFPTNTKPGWSISPGHPLVETLGTSVCTPNPCLCAHPVAIYFLCSGIPLPIPQALTSCKGTLKQRAHTLLLLLTTWCPRPSTCPHPPFCGTRVCSCPRRSLLLQAYQLNRTPLDSSSSSSPLDRALSPTSAQLGLFIRRNVHQFGSRPFVLTARSGDRAVF
jgi:hypothetical protein